ncbi:MAG: hypothetical protein Q8S33_21390 [Myxococcales bacterium]|nr:hypothetical protein [Myxococcales bacterium]
MRSAIALLTGLVAGAAFAHGLAPQTLGVAPNPWTPGGLVVPTTFGLLVTDDRCTWQWVCPDHLGLGPREQPTWFATPSGTLFAAAFSGLYVSRDRGCSFSKQSFFDGTGAADLAVGEGALFVTSSKFGVMNGLAVSTDDGQTFGWTSLRENDAFFNSVKLAPSRPQRLYVSSWFLEPRRARLSVSDDRGQTFTAIDVPVTLAPGSVFLVHAVSTSDPDLVFASITDDSALPARSSLLRSVDGGRTFSVVLQADGRVSSVAQDGARWWVAVGDRVFTSTDGVSFAVLPSPKQRACVARVEAETLVCGRQPVEDGFGLATLGAGVTPMLTWDRISGPISCPAGSPAATACAVTWPVELAELGLPADHVAACGAPVPEPPAKKTGCETTSGGLLLAAAGFFLQRRRRVESGGE